MSYDEFGFDSYITDYDPSEQEMASAQSVEEEATGPHVPMREAFPPADTEYMGGFSDGWEYRSVFGGSRLENTYNMVLQFLKEEGYGDLPLPANAEELKLFRKPRRKQLELFRPQGYIHNPIKILFSDEKGKRNNLILCIYNEKAEGHLLRFHGVMNGGWFFVKSFTIENKGQTLMVFISFIKN